jgi:hypothetical protein
MAASPLLLLLLPPPVGLLAALAFLARPRGARVLLTGRHVLVTGGSSGIGLAMATAAAREGARVSILARNAARFDDSRAAIHAATGQDVGVLAADVRDAGAVERAAGGRPRRRPRLQPGRVCGAGDREAGHGGGQVDGGHQPHGHVPPRQGSAPRQEGAHPRDGPSRVHRHHVLTGRPGTDPSLYFTALRALPLSSM